jgi:hypothetical protein
MTKNKAMRMPGKGRPAASQLVIQKPPTTKPHPRNLAKTRNPLLTSSSSQSQRVSNTDSFGASPASSALDHFTGRDPRKASTTIACQSGCFAT